MVKIMVQLVFTSPENSPFLGSSNGLQRAPTGSNGPASRAQRARRAQRAQRARRARQAREAVALNEPIIPSGAGVTLYIQLGRSTTVLGI